MTHEQRHRVVIVPVLIWAGLMALLVLTWAYAYLPGAPIKPAISLSIGIAKALLIACSSCNCAAAPRWCALHP